MEQSSPAETNTAPETVTAVSDKFYTQRAEALRNSGIPLLPQLTDGVPLNLAMVGGVAATKLQ